jgi:hypothetical protein
MSEIQDYSQSPAPLETTTSTLAIVSLVSGILSWLIIPLIGSILAVITGHMAKNEIKRSRGVLTGDGLATAGLVLGYLQIAVGVCGFCVFVILVLMGPSVGSVFSNIIEELATPVP